MKYLIKWYYDGTDESGIDFINEQEYENYPLYLDVRVKEFPDTAELFRVIVAGGREFNDYALLEREMDFLLQNKQDCAIVIVSGAARGADKLGELYAENHGYFVDSHPADWNTYGKSAGYRRNAEMADKAEALALFWDGKSRGSGHMLDIAKNKGLPYRVINY